MRAVWITRHGGPAVLEVRESPDPEPKAGEVRVRVRACGLNFAEVMARQGLYPDAPPPPCVVGYEAAGIIDMVGAGVDSSLAGKRAIALSRFGGHAEVLCVPAAQVLEIPEQMSFEEAAALPVNYLTAYHMLFRVACVRQGEGLLVHMAAGGVGLAVLQLCRTVAGVTTFGTASSSKHEVLRDNGCTHPIDYRRMDYFAEVMRLTGGKGVDVVLDALGGKDWRKGYRLLRPAGRLLMFGFANMVQGGKRSLVNIGKQMLSVPRFGPLALMEDNRAVAGVNMLKLWGEIEMLRGELQAVLRLYEEQKIKPRIDMVFPFTEAAQAHRRIEEGKNIGKILLRP